VRNKEKHGPYSVEDVQAYLSSGHLQLNDLAWREGMKDWVPLSQFPGLNLLEVRLPPPPPIVPTPVVAKTPVTKRGPSAFSCSGCLIIFVALTVLGIIANYFEDTKKTTNASRVAQSPQSSQTTKTKSSAKQSNAANGDEGLQEGDVKTVTQNGKKMTVALVDSKFYSIISVQRKSSITGSFSSTKADGVFIIVKLVVQNASKEGGTVATTLMKLIDSGGREFDTSSSGTTALVMSGDDTAELFMGEINPGITKQFTLIFDVTENAKDFKLKIPAATFSLGKEALLPVPKAPYQLK
jgi:uncharacterized protein (UPF0333 family)